MCRTHIAVIIAGAVSRADLDALAEIAVAEGFSRDWDVPGMSRSEGELSDMLLFQIEEERRLQLVKSEGWSEQPEIEAFCSERGLTLRIEFDPDSESCGGARLLVPGQPEFRFDMDEIGGQVMLSARQIQSLGPEGVAAFIAKASAPMTCTLKGDDSAAPEVQGMTPERRAQLDAMLAAGVNFGDLCAAYGQYQADHEPHLKAYYDAAAGGDDLETDSSCIVSAGADAGAWVLSWQWVRDDAAGVTRDEEESTDEV